MCWPSSDAQCVARRTVRRFLKRVGRESIVGENTVKPEVSIEGLLRSVHKLMFAEDRDCLCCLLSGLKMTESEYMGHEFPKGIWCTASSNPRAQHLQSIPWERLEDTLL